jgi:hypothetical protein
MKRRPSSGIWPASAWSTLLRQAAQLLEEAAPGVQWTFGGGSAMAHIYGHRISYDADIFLHDVQVIAYLTPRLNDVAASLAEHYDEQANGIKLTTGRGDIDFVVAGDVTNVPPRSISIPGIVKPVQMQDAAEILAKKIQFRGFRFTHRDMFDLAMLLQESPSSVDLAFAQCSPGAVAQAIDVMWHRLPVLTAELPDYVNPTVSFNHLLVDAEKILDEFLKRI